MTGAQRGGLAAVAAVCVISRLPFLSMAYTMDEPYFLAIARQIIGDPARPLAFSLNWYGEALPASQINTIPLLFPYLLALALDLSRGAELLTRSLLLPLDILSAAALYLLAARFLRNPLAAALLAFFSPAYFVSTHHLMAEKLAMALGLWGLVLLQRSDSGRDRRAFAASAALMGLAVLAKYSAALFLAPALWSLRGAARPWTAALSYAGGVLGPVLLYQSVLGELGQSLEAVAKINRTGLSLPWSTWPTRLRSTLCFAGAGALGATALVPALVQGRRSWLALGAACALAAALFWPGLDSVAVRPLDRWLGIGVAAAFLFLAGSLARRGRELPGWDLCAPWIGAVLALQLFVYWSVVARFIAFLVPPLVILAAGALERARPRARGPAFWALAAAASVSLLALAVDAAYADTQRRLARLISEEYLSRGRTVWITGHWGFQHYLEAAGASSLDAGRGGWREVGPGSLVIIPEVNTNQLRPPLGLRPASVRTLTMDSALPLRLISTGAAQAGFHSSVFGFLPFTPSFKPLDSFTLVEF